MRGATGRVRVAELAAGGCYQPSARPVSHGVIDDAGFPLVTEPGGQPMTELGAAGRPRHTSRRNFLRHSVAGGLIIGGGVLLGRSTGKDLEVGRFYVSNDGSDANSGRTPGEAWLSVARVNSALAAGEVRHGDVVMFRRGDEFFGNIDSIPRVGGPGPRLTLTAYGVGPRPKISGYKLVESPDAWHLYRPGVWRIDLVDKSSHTGNTGNESSNAGFILVDGVIHGAKKWTLDGLSVQWDFFNDARFLYVRSDKNPARLASSLRVAVDGDIITGQSRLLVSGLELCGTGGNGYNQIAAHHTEVVDCRVGPVGGSALFPRIRYGNGVQIWFGSSDSLIHHNEFTEVYDVATTIQGVQKGSNIGASRCSFRSNTIFNCTQSFEYGVIGSQFGDGAGIFGCDFTDNVCVGGGRSWGYATREDKDGKGNFLLAYWQDGPIDIQARRNVFFDAVDCYMFVNTNGFRFKNGFVSDENTIALRPGTLIQGLLPYTIEQADRWVAETGRELHSKWTLVPPSVVSPHDARAYVAQNLATLREH
jgi:hypothetical protein